MDFKARRYDATKFDTSLAKSWLHCCEEWHGVACQFALMLRGDPAPRIGKFRLIEVVSQQLVLLDVLVESTYIALSYVWGRKNSFLTTRADLATPSEPGGLNLVIEAIPNTIRDAITLTQELGICCLWVDSLCIVHDDKDDKGLGLV